MTSSSFEYDPLLQARRQPSPPPVQSYPRTPLYLSIAIAFCYCLVLLNSSTQIPLTTPPTSYHLAIPHVPISFLAIGDWGRKGKFGQRRVAQAIADTVNRTLNTYGYNPHFIFSVGDNFYKSGVSSIHDPHFKESYTDVYNHLALSNVPWYSILGNHDHVGSIQAQVDFTAHDARWNMPAPYYSHRFTDNLIALFLDTTPFINNHYGKRAREHNHQSPQAQLRWLKRQLAEAPASAYFLIVAHHNLYTMSTAGHLGAKELREALEPLFLPYRHRILAYLSGHEHSMMHMQPYGRETEREAPFTHVVDHFISGAGSKLDDIVQPKENLEHWKDCCGVLPVLEDENHGRTVWGESVHGFFAFRFDGRSFVAQAIDEDGNMIYEYEKSVA